jgi:hypothetical protein
MEQVQDDQMLPDNSTESFRAPPKNVDRRRSYSDYT